MRVAIMQPYFFPYAGYFRLFSCADVFIVYDCVQFPRRGWVHRNRLANGKSELDWLTLPVEYAPVDTLISQMRLSTDVRGRMAEQIRRFPLLREAPLPDVQACLQWAELEDGRPLVDYLENTLRACAAAFGVSRPMIRSSTFKIPTEITAQARILEICAAAGASAYVNSPGGRELYDTATFQQRGISLHFLDPWKGSSASVLEGLVRREAALIADDIAKQAL